MPWGLIFRIITCPFKCIFSLVAAMCVCCGFKTCCTFRFRSCGWTNFFLRSARYDKFSDTELVMKAKRITDAPSMDEPFFLKLKCGETGVIMGNTGPAVFGTWDQLLDIKIEQGTEKIDFILFAGKQQVAQGSVNVEDIFRFEKSSDTEMVVPLRKSPKGSLNANPSIVVNWMFPDNEFLPLDPVLCSRWTAEAIRSRTLVEYAAFCSGLLDKSGSWGRMEKVYCTMVEVNDEWYWARFSGKAESQKWLKNRRSEDVPSKAYLVSSILSIDEPLDCADETFVLTLQNKENGEDNWQEVFVCEPGGRSRRSWVDGLGTFLKAWRLKKKDQKSKNKEHNQEKKPKKKNK